ncbi:type II toxin-antitoxin system Phd/YefM family antitoxin [Variovorax beijingensis]|jgi:prevent-host-death family protein|uniref:Antitoxin n=1 Tax=Variovorax beijingensis TaxID=2496117 RepID=A0A3P3EJL6_9BURK|nr:type II toxin-antitoxin system prevent-host-death family antitoxin [Variovorax beijingensis]RRH86540.1 type II toxin-antitoxin system Phd/YefM family antitoxin [Variovorax beijingensis]RSZ31666.1 type II toxin-antitoxin system Phd/YefM family antitoxin [Variovorax beijingensis]
MQISATEAKNRFGYYLGQAEREPVHVMKNDRVAGVIVSAARFAELEALEQKKSMAQRKREFSETYKDWIAAQNDLVDRIGVFGEEFRPW